VAVTTRVSPEADRSSTISSRIEVAAGSTARATVFVDAPPSKWLSPA
jgi:hypothetical protein